MHGHGDLNTFLDQIGGFLGWYYLLLAAMNGIAAFYCWEKLKKNGMALFLLIVALGFVVIAPIAFSGNPEWMRLISVPEGIKTLIDQTISKAYVYTLGTLGVLVVMFLGRRFFAQPIVAWLLLIGSLFFMGMSITDPEFAAIVTKADNVPIVGMVYLLGFFTWLATWKAIKNDDRIDQGLEPLESLEQEKVLVWPDLVYIEMICMVALTALLIVWAIGLQAPLEAPASSVKTPNPSKAPWYFLGLQEMLVYFDPWMAGVVLPSLIVVGLMAIPFIDYNKKGSGYYTIKERPFAYIIFQLGFLELWVTLIVLGTFLRGPNWNFFGPYEVWDPHKVEALNNVDLSQYFWVKWLGTEMPKVADGATFLQKLWMICVREIPGIVVTIAYFVILPPLMALTVFRKMFARMGFIRFMVMSNLLLFMGLLPIKMALRWMFNLKYIVSIPEFFLNL
jgi:hypothetical protein